MANFDAQGRVRWATSRDMWSAAVLGAIAAASVTIIVLWLLLMSMPSRVLCLMGPS